MELIVAVGALTAGLALSLAAGRLLVAGVIAITFGAAAPVQGGVNAISAPPGARSTTPVSSSMASTA